MPSKAVVPAGDWPLPGPFPSPPPPSQLWSAASTAEVASH